MKKNEILGEFFQIVCRFKKPCGDLSEVNGPWDLNTVRKLGHLIIETCRQVNGENGERVLKKYLILANLGYGT